MLPVVVEGGTKVGGLCKDWFGIKQGTPVLVGVGDLQCSFLSAIATDTDAGKWCDNASCYYLWKGVEELTVKCTTS